MQNHLLDEEARALNPVRVRAMGRSGGPGPRGRSGREDGPKPHNAPAACGQSPTFRPVMSPSMPSGSIAPEGIHMPLGHRPTLATSSAKLLSQAHATYGSTSVATTRSLGFRGGHISMAPRIVCHAHASLPPRPATHSTLYARYCHIGHLPPRPRGMVVVCLLFVC